MSKKPAEEKEEDRRIAENRRARHEYFIEETFEAGVMLEGWEVKSLRAGRVQITDAYVTLKKGEAFMIGGHITPLISASTHVKTDPIRTRKLLLQRSQIDKLVGKVERAGYTVIPLDLHWTRGRAKLSIGLAKGKKQHDKRADEKAKDWQRQKERLLKH